MSDPSNIMRVDLDRDQQALPLVPAIRFLTFESNIRFMSSEGMVEAV